MNIGNRKIIIVVVMSMLISACASGYVLPFDASELVGTQFTVVDNRPEQEKLGGSGSSNIWSCEYAIRDIADSRITPPRIDLLKSRFHKQLGEKLKGKTVTVDRFKVVRNMQAALRRGVGASKGILGDAISGAGCIAGPEIDGSYAIADNPESLPSVTIILSGKVGTATFSVRHFETVKSIDEIANVMPQIVDRALTKAVSQLQNQL